MNLFRSLKKTVKLFSNPSQLSRLPKALTDSMFNRLIPSGLPGNKTEMSQFAKTIIFPVPIVICGSMTEKMPCFNLLGNFGIISPKCPRPIIYISSSKTHYTNIGIRNTGKFSVNIPSPKIMDKADYLGVVSGRDTDKSGILEVFFGRDNNVPCITECSINYLCKVLKTFLIDNMEVFIAEIYATYVSKTCLRSGRIDYNDINPLMYTPGAYRIASQPVGKPYSEYKKYLDQNQAH